MQWQMALYNMGIGNFPHKIKWAVGCTRVGIWHTARPGRGSGAWNQTGYRPPIFNSNSSCHCGWIFQL